MKEQENAKISKHMWKNTFVSHIQSQKQACSRHIYFIYNLFQMKNSQFELYREASRTGEENIMINQKTSTFENKILPSHR